MKNKTLKEQIKAMSYSEFTLWLDDNFDMWEPYVTYEDWSVIKFNTDDGVPFYIYYGHEVEGETSDIFEVEPVAQLSWFANLTDPGQIELGTLFGREVVVSGEYDYPSLDGEITYLWFRDVDKTI